jgi:hypothetical protein
VLDKIGAAPNCMIFFPKISKPYNHENVDWESPDASC